MNKLPTLKDYLTNEEWENMGKHEWINIDVEYPPFFKPVLTTDGKSCEIRTLRIRDGIKFWFSHSKSKMHFIVQYWQLLPELP
jgi:hypothetical protein